MTPTMKQAYDALVANAEGSGVTTTGGYIFRDVYLDNAKPKEWSGRKWAGALSALEKVGAYISLDEYAFGMVRIP